MSDPLISPLSAYRPTPSVADSPSSLNNAAPLNPADAAAQKVEQLLWAEMLSHAGLEEAFTRGGGEAAASFSRYIVESIAEDLAKAQPLGFAKAIPGANAPTQETSND